MERALSAEGVEVETITTDDDGPGRRNELGDGEARKENGVFRRYFPKQTEFYKISMPLGKWLRREVRQYDIVHIHALFSHTSIAAARAARSASIPYIIRPLGVLNQYGVTQRRAFLKRLSLKWVEGPILRDAAAVHLTLEAEQLEAEQLGIPFRPVVVPLGIESAPASPTHETATKSVLFLSRVNRVKNIECLLDAWALLHPSHSEWRLTIAGSGDMGYVESLKQKAEELGIAASVDWPGHVDGEEKAQLVAEAAVFTLPSHSENFGIAAAEAMLAGKACVFTHGVAVGVLAADHDAAMISGATPEELARALSSLMENAQERGGLGACAKAFAESELTAAVMGRRLKELYERLVTKTY
jgi:glycosyltransferase involved in cell wall biosynthesis